MRGAVLGTVGLGVEVTFRRFKSNSPMLEPLLSLPLCHPDVLDGRTVGTGPRRPLRLS